MNAMIVEMLAAGLTISQLFNYAPEQFKPQFNPSTDQAQVKQILTDGCSLLTKEFKAEKGDLGMMIDVLKMSIEMAREEAKKAEEEAAAAGQPPPKQEGNMFLELAKKFDIPAFNNVFKQYCLGEEADLSAAPLDEVIKYYNKAIGDLPDHTKLKGMRLPEASVLLDKDDNRFTEIYSDDNRRHWVNIDDLPDYVANAFIAAEDKRYLQHNGLDLHGVIRAFMTNLGKDGRPQGGSTITQQVVKNILLNDKVLVQRKMREMVLATRIEKLLSKKEILELYINYVFLGRASWGIEMAARNYFGKPAKFLTKPEAAFLAGLTRGPNYYHPVRHPDRAKSRRDYVLDRMVEDKYITLEEARTFYKQPLALIDYEPPRTKGGFYFIDEINRQAKRVAKIPSLTSGSFTVYSTLNSELQKATDRALQDGLRNYEAAAGRSQFRGAQGNIGNDIRNYKRTWQEVLPTVRPKLFDVQWTLATVIQTGGRAAVTRNGKTSYVNQGVRVGLPDGRTMPLTGNGANSLALYDLVFVKEGTGKNARAEIRNPSTVQGAIVVLENQSGKVLAMSGGFSYVQSQLNRVTQTARQTGSTLKPFIYLSALNLGYQPNTLIADEAVSFPPINKGGQWWTPKNYDGNSNGLVTIRQAVEKSLNLPTARMMATLGPPNNPAAGLDYIQGVTKELGIYSSTERVYPFVLGAQPARLIDMAVAYATIANDGLKPTPQFIEKIARDGKTVWERERFSLRRLPSVDRVAFHQLRRILEGTLVRGTATRIKRWAGSVGGKTGTSNDQNDAWFVGFSKDVTVAVWVGYDNRNIRANLGGEFTGGRVALPIAEQVFESTFKLVKERSDLPGAPAEIRPQITEQLIDGVSAAGSVNVFRRPGDPLRPVKHAAAAVTEDELAMLPQMPDDPLSESPDDQLPHLDPDEYRTAESEETPQEERYNPGVEEPFEMNARRGSQNDPMFTLPTFFNSRGN